MKIAISKMEKIDRAAYKNYKELGVDTYSSFIDSDFRWACDLCLQTKKAIEGNPNLQNYCWNPNYAYYDADKNCRTCNSEFVFTKEEKKYWYESLKFWIDSEPVNCVSCRREIRQLKVENKILSGILKKEEKEISTKELEKVVKIYSKWQMEQKAKYYKSIIKKRVKTGFND